MKRRSKEGGLNPQLKKELEARALRNYHFALDRVGPACPWWQKKGWKYRAQLLRVYFKAALKNHFRDAYNRPGEFYHVDHIFPLRYKVKGKHVGCGLHVAANLHVILAPINLAKGTMIVPEWLDKNPVEDAKRHKEQATAKREAKRKKWLAKRKQARKTRERPTEAQRAERDELMSRFDYAISKD